MGNQFENVPKNDAPLENIENQENGVESQIEEEMTKLDSSLVAVKNEIDGLSEEEKNDLLNSKLYDKGQRNSSAVWAGLLTAFATVGAIAEAEILPEINWNLHDDKITVETLGVVTIGAALMAIYKISDYLKYNNRVKKANQN